MHIYTHITDQHQQHQREEKRDEREKKKVVGEKTTSDPDTGITSGKSSAPGSRGGRDAPHILLFSHSLRVSRSRPPSLPRSICVFVPSISPLFLAKSLLWLSASSRVYVYPHSAPSVRVSFSLPVSPVATERKREIDDYLMRQRQRRQQDPSTSSLSRIRGAHFLRGFALLYYLCLFGSALH